MQNEIQSLQIRSGTQLDGEKRMHEKLEFAQKSRGFESKVSGHPKRAEMMIQIAGSPSIETIWDILRELK